MSHQQYLETARAAMSAGWTPTENFDESGRPLWVQPGDAGMATLDVFLTVDAAAHAA